MPFGIRPFPAPSASSLRFLLPLLLICLAGCAGRSTEAIPEPTTVGEGLSVFVLAEGTAMPAEDLAVAVTSCLQSECAFSAANDIEDADRVVRLRVRHIRLQSAARGLDAGRIFHLGALGAMLGVTVGAIAGGRAGALVGAAAGAGAGVTASAADGGVRKEVWELRALLGVGTRRTPDEDELSEITIQSGPVAGRAEALPILEDGLARAVVRHFNSRPGRS